MGGRGKPASSQLWNGGRWTGWRDGGSREPKNRKTLNDDVRRREKTKLSLTLTRLFHENLLRKTCATPLKRSLTREDAWLKRLRKNDVFILARNFKELGMFLGGKFLCCFFCRWFWLNFQRIIFFLFFPLLWLKLEFLLYNLEWNSFIILFKD